MPTEYETNHAKHGPGAVTDGEFVSAERDAMEFFQVANRALDYVPLAIAHAVKAAAADRAGVGAAREHGARPMLAAPGTHRASAVALIAGQRVRVATWPSALAGNPHAVEERRRSAQVVRLAGFHGCRQRQPAAVSHQGELCAKPAAAAA